MLRSVILTVYVQFLIIEVSIISTPGCVGLFVPLVSEQYQRLFHLF